MGPEPEDETAPFRGLVSPSTSLDLSRLGLHLASRLLTPHPSTTLQLRPPGELARLILFPAHSSRSEPSTRSTSRRTSSQDERGNSTNGEPVGVPELGFVSPIPDPVSDDDPECEVDGEGDEGGEEGEEGGEGHEDGACSRGETDTELRAGRARAIARASRASEQGKARRMLASMSEDTSPTPTRRLTKPIMTANKESAPAIG